MSFARARQQAVSMLNSMDEAFSACPPYLQLPKSRKFKLFRQLVELRNRLDLLLLDENVKPDSVVAGELLSIEGSLSRVAGFGRDATITYDILKPGERADTTREEVNNAAALAIKEIIREAQKEIIAKTKSEIAEAKKIKPLRRRKKQIEAVIARRDHECSKLYAEIYSFFEKSGFILKHIRQAAARLSESAPVESQSISVREWAMGEELPELYRRTFNLKFTATLGSVIPKNSAGPRNSPGLEFCISACNFMRLGGEDSLKPATAKKHIENYRKKRSCA